MTPPPLPAHEPTLVPAADHSLLFVVPAYRRVDLASICYRQQADACLKLRAQGIEADVLVIADDKNLEEAQDAGLLTLRHVNRLGAKLNAGYRWAHAKGYEYVCPVGSDSWIATDRWEHLPGPGTMLCTQNYTCLSPDGARQGWFKIDYAGGVGSRTFRVDMLASSKFRPLEAWRPRGCDTATLRSITRHHGLPGFAYTDIHPYEIVGFQSDVQITDYARLVDNYLHAWQEPFSGLAAHFPAALVAQIESYYREKTP